MAWPLSSTSLPQSVTADALAQLVGTAACPLILDVSRPAAFEADDRMIAGALRRAADRLRLADLPASDRGLVACCVHGHNVSQGVAAKLRAEGVAAAWLEGGITAFAAAGGPMRRRVPAFAATERGGSVWVTRRRPKIDRIACPWLIRRFIDPEAAILYAEPDQVAPVAEEIGGVAFDIEDAPVTHRGEMCSFDDLIAIFGLSDPALGRLAPVVRGADTGRFDLAPQAAGLAAFSFGLSARFADDHEALAHGMALYDSLYAWARDASGETHHWTGRTR